MGDALRSNPLLISSMVVALTCSASVSSDARDDRPGRHYQPSETSFGSTSSCSYASKATALGLSDGCNGPPAGTPQFPSLLSAYGSNRPQWDVTGLDYYVGVPPGSVLKSTAANVPAGCWYDSGHLNLTCNGNGLTIQDLDFSVNGGMSLYISGANNVVTGNKFALAPKCKEPLLKFAVSANSPIRITNNTFDGGGGTCGSLNWGTMVSGEYGQS